MTAARRRAARWAAALLVVVSAAAPRLATAQDAPPTGGLLPALPDELDVLTAGASPVVWRACNAVGLAVGLVVVAGTLAGAPPEATVPLNEAIGTVAGPVVQVVFEVCQQIPLPDDPPTCATDELVPLLPSLGRPLPPAALLASELRALDGTLTDIGLPLEGALGDAADDLLQCARGMDPEPSPPVTTPPPPAEEGGGAVVVPPSGGGGAAGGGGAMALPPVRTGPPAAADEGAPREEVLPPTLVATSPAQDGAGIAYGLLAVAGLAALAWLHAGSGRSRRAPRAVPVG